MPADPSLFREMNVPFEDDAAANEAIHAFFDDLAELRKKHKIANVHCIVQGSCMYEESGEGEWINSMHFGDSLRALSMTAFAYGLADATRIQGKTWRLFRALKHSVLWARPGPISTVRAVGQQPMRLR